MQAARYIVTRALLGLLTVWLLSVAVFVAAEVIPQDPALAALGRESTPAQRALFRERAHLNDPAVERYVRWSAGIVRLDFGPSVITGQPIASQLMSRLGYTATLAGLSLLFGVALAIPLAMMAAQRSGSALDVVASGLAMAVVAVPEFVLGIGVLLIFAVEVHWLPVISSGIASGELSALVLPTVTLGLGVAAYVFRFARVSIEEALRAPYVRTAILNGLSGRRILFHHVLPNAGIVVVNAVALNAIYLLGSVIVVETVFSYPGLGTLLVNAIGNKDIVVIEGVSVIMATLFVTINFVADAVVLALNPRLRTG